MRKRAPTPTRSNKERRVAWLALSVIAIFMIAIVIGGLQSCGRRSTEPSDTAPVTSSSETVVPTTSETAPTTETAEPTATPTDTPTPEPTDTPTPVPTDTPTPEPTDTPTPVPTDTPTPVPTDTPTPTKAPKPTEPKPTEPPATPTPLPPPPPPPDTPTPAPPPPDTPTPAPPSRDIDAEFDAGIEYVKSVGYEIAYSDRATHEFHFCNGDGSVDMNVVYAENNGVWYLSGVGPGNARNRHGKDLLAVLQNLF